MYTEPFTKIAGLTNNLTKTWLNYQNSNRPLAEDYQTNQFYRVITKLSIFFLDQTHVGIDAHEDQVGKEVAVELSAQAIDR